ncbi:MAG: SLC13 family permease [Pseudomonadota bacterium]
MGGDLVLTTEMIQVLAVLGVTVVLFVLEILRVDVVALCALVAIGLLGLLPPDQLFAGFASNAVISIIAVMIIGTGLDRTGVMAVVASMILRLGGRTETRIIPLVAGTVGVISGFMQNVGATALFLPVISRIASRSQISLSRLLMPMGFCAILGGTLTMVGSSPLILLNDLIQNSNRNLPPGADTVTTFHLFSVTPIGLILLAAGILFFLLFGRFLLPASQVLEKTRPGRTRSYFAKLYGVKGDVYELLVTSESPLVGLTIGEAEVLEGAPSLVAIRNGDDQHLAPASEEMIWVGTVLGAMGEREQIGEFAEANELVVRPRLVSFGALLNPSRAGIAESVITPGSPLVGKTVQEVRFRKAYGFSVLALQRADEVHRQGLRSLPLQVGDTLIMHGTWRDLGRASGERDFVVVTDLPKEEQRPHKVGWALAFFLLSMGLIVLSDFRLSVCLLVGAVGMVVTQVLSMDEAYASVSWKTVFLLASLIPLGLAMDTTGTAAWMAQQALAFLGDVPVLVLQILLATMTTFFTLVMSNVGATALLVPLAINVALAVGADPAVFALIVAISASNAFLIPTHQVSALIMSPGGYRVTDFLKTGGLMTIVFLLVSIPAINWVYG